MDAIFTEHTMTKGAEPVRDGNRYTLPDADGKIVTWNGATTLAEELDNPYALTQWKMRQVAWGLGRRPDLMALAGSVTNPNDDSDKATLREVVKGALSAAHTEEGSNHGTALHSIFQKIDTGTPMSQVPEYFHPDIVARQQELARHGIILLPEYRERVIRCAIYGCSGRLDGIGRLADGSLVLVDDKSEKDPEKYPHAKAVQMGIYANAGEMMDYDANRIVPMPNVRKDFGLVIHSRPGTGVCKIYRVDIARGWAAARIAVEVREWRKSSGLVAPYVSEGSWAPPSPVTVPAREEFVPAAKPALGEIGSGVAPIANGAPDPARVEEIKNAVLSEVHGRLPEVQDNPIPTNPQPAAKVAPVVDPTARVTEILDVRKNDKSRLQGWARTLGCTDLLHHRKWLAEWIVKATPGSGAIEPSGDDDAVQSAHPQTMTEAGLTQPAPAQPPGQPVVPPPTPAVDLSAEGVTAQIGAARSVADIGALWKAYTDAYGPDSWQGWVREQADAKAAELTAQPAPATNPYNPLA